MNIKELEASFKKIDEIAKTVQIQPDFVGDEESTATVVLSAKKEVGGFESVVTKSADLSKKGLESTAEHDFSLMAINLSDVDVEEYKQEKIKEYLARLEKNKGLEAVAGKDLPDVPVTYRTRDNIWVLMADYFYQSESAHHLTAYKDFKFDLASIPRVFWLVVASFELSLPGPLFHDLLYQNGGKLPIRQVEPYYHFSRKEADQLFLELMEKSGVPFWRRNIAYQAVRQFAGFAWQDNPDNIFVD